MSVSAHKHVGWVVLVLALGILLPAAAQASAPTLVGHDPEQGEELGIDQPIEILFDQAMSHTSVEAALTLDPRTTFTIEWTDDRTLWIVPTDAWSRATTYAIRVSTDAASALGEPLVDPIGFSLTTVGYLEVTQTIPADGAEEIAVDSAVLVLFNRPVVPLVALSDPAAAELPAPVRFEPEIVGTGEWLNTSIYQFVPSEPLRGGTLYTASVLSGLQDTTGGIVPEDVVWHFATERPRIVWRSPERDEDLVPIDTEIRVTFNMPMSTESAAEHLHVRTASLLGEVFATTITGRFEADGNTLAFIPDEELAFDTSYVVEIEEGLRGEHGGLGLAESSSWRFRTVPLPRITGTTPSDGQQDAHPYTSFVIRFNAPIDPDTVLENVTIEPAPEPSELRGYFRRWDNSYVLQFGAQPSQDYAVRIGPDIADPYGNTIGEWHSVRFRTAPLDPTAWLHVPGRIGTFSSYQAARLFVAHRNTDRLTLTLSRLTLDDYFEALDSWYHHTPPALSELRRWTVSVSSELNALEYTAVDLMADGGLLEPGVYVIELDAAGVERNTWQHKHMLVVSPVNLTIKTAYDETLVWATDLDSGDPLAGLILRAYDGDGTYLSASVTDRDGLATFSGSDETDWRGLTIAGNIPFTLASSQWDDGISVWAFGMSYGGHMEWRTHLDTDRPIYRPDQTVFFRGIFREEDDASYSLPAAETVEVTIRDAAWNLLLEETLPIDSYGTYSGDLALAADASLGTYQIESRIGDAYATHTFQVAAYRPPEFEVVILPSADETASGTSFDASIELAYFFGGAVADHDVTWRVYSEGYRFSPGQLGRYTFTDTDDPWSWWGWWWRTPETPSPILEGSGRTDGNGRLAIEIPANTKAENDADPFAGSRTLTIEATATGKDGQTISGRADVVVHAGDFYIGLASGRAIGRAGDPMAVDVVSVDWDGERLPETRLTYAVHRREWENVFEVDDAGGGRWTWTTTDVEVARGSLATDENGVGVLRFTPPEGGTYKVSISGTDAAGRLIRSSLFAWASGPETVSWRRSNDDRITLISDKTQYDVGETAEILIPSPYPGEQWALITIERAGVISREVVRLESNSEIYRVPITDAHIPNIYVGVVLVHGRQDALALAQGATAVAEMKVGYVSLDVARAPRILSIDLTPSDEAPGPGDAMSYELLVTDASGAPVQAALSFDLVDKAILTLQPRAANAIAETFYARRGLSVSTASGLTISVNRLVVEQQEEADAIEVARGDSYDLDDAMVGAAAPMAAAEEAGGMERMDSAAEQLPEGVSLREEFEDTAHWEAAVVTDAEGKAVIRLDLPDNLTTWVARAVGVTGRTEVGEGVTELLVTKPLLIRPVAPRFLVVGDRVRLAAIVSNQTDVDLSTNVTLGQTGLALEDPATQQVPVPAGGEATVTWWGTVTDVPSVDLAFSAVAGNLSDAARPRLTTGPNGTLLVYRYTAPEVVGTAGQLDSAGSRTELVLFPANAAAERSELIVRLETSLAAAMQQGLDYLEHFEYECTEQVVSRFLPNILTYRALTRLGIENPELAERLPGLVAEGLEKLIVRQNSDGGWGWWEYNESSATLTAYVVFALLHAQQNGFVVDLDMLSRGLDFLDDAIIDITDLTSSSLANRQAWLLYVLTLGGRAERIEKPIDALYEERAKLSHYARAYLAMSLKRVGNSDGVVTLVSDLMNAAILSSTGAHWEEPDYDWWAMNTDTRSTAIILDALVDLDPSQALLPNVVRWLMIARKDGIWETTQETAWALIALTDWMDATGELEGAYDYGAALDGAELHGGTASAQTHLDPTSITVTGETLDPGTDHRLTISRGDGPGTLYYTAHLSVRLPVEDVEPLSRGLIVQRQYVPADCPLDEICPELTEVAVGDSIQVRLTIIAPHDLYYVVIEDPFPAGCEAVDTSLATASLADIDPGLFRESASGGWPWFYWWWWRWYSRSELRDEKAVLFADYLPAGTYSYQYTLRASVPGEFRVLPTSGYEFYFPEVFGRSDGRILTVTEGE